MTQGFPQQYENMSLRDHFAGLAMQGLLAKPLFQGDDKWLCKRAVEIADILLAELARKETQ